MYEQEFQGDVLYMMLYAVVAALNLVACCYLLFRRGNAFAPDITPPFTAVLAVKGLRILRVIIKSYEK